jgi:arabinogalactan oligomer/maltooligosaccharide transport system permease protein
VQQPEKRSKPFLKQTWWVHLCLILACIMSIYPILRIFSVSLRSSDNILSTDLSLIPADASWQAYWRVMQETGFFSWLANSLAITCMTAFLGVSLAATAAYALSRFSFSLRAPILVFLMSTQMMPAVMLLLPLYFMLRKMNLLDTYAGVIVAYSVTTLPFSVWLLKGYFDTIPKSLEEAAKVDGLTTVGSFWRIVLPLSTPSLAIAFLFNVTQAWNEYIVARVVLQSSENYTWPLGLFELQGDFETKWAMFAAASVLVTLPVLAVFLYSAKWLLSGLTLGGVKG